MFLQKLRLDPEKSYETTASTENLLENLQLTFSHIPVITLYSSKAKSDQEIDVLVKDQRAVIDLTVPQYNKYKDSFDCTHIVLPDLVLLNDFGYSLDDLDKPLIACGQNGLERLRLCQFFVKAEKNDRFVAAYILAQMYPAAIVTKHPDRVRMFCKIFELGCNVYPYDSQMEEECVIFLEGHREVECERVFVIGPRHAGYERLNLDIALAGKFKYRILDVMKQLSPSVVKRKEQFDYSRFKDISK